MTKKIAYHSLCFLLLLLTQSYNVAGQDYGESKQLDHPVCIFIPIEQDQNIFIPAPDHTDARISPTAEFIVNYPADIDIDAQNAFAYAIEIWSYQIATDVPIVIDFSFSDLGPTTLGSAGPNNFFRNFSGATKSNTWYPVALANKLAGFDLDEGNADINISFNSEFNWYFGTDGNVPAGQFDFVSVVLHELGHGLGFTGSGSSDGTNGTWGSGTTNPFIYDDLVVNTSNDRTLDFTSPSTDLHDFLTSNDLFIDGSETVVANGDTPAKIYAPSTFDQGSSYSHWNESTYNGTTNALMTPQIGSAEAIHDVGDITRALFKDLGWESKPNDDLTPFNVKATGISSDRIDLTWSDNSDTEDGFIIKRSLNESSGFTTIDTVNADILRYNDVSVGSGETYFYKIVAFESSGTLSEETDVVSASACSNSLPTGGTWTGSAFTALSGGVSSSNSNISITQLSDDEYLFSDITGSLYAEFGDFSSSQSYTVINTCSELTINTFVDAEFDIETNSSTGFGPGSYNEVTQTITLPWFDPNNIFGGITTFTRNGDVGLESPATSSSTINFTQIGAHSMNISWTSGDGTNRLVLVKESEPIEDSEHPVDNTNYPALSSHFSSETTTIGNARVVYNDNGNSVLVTGLTKNTNYFVYVFEYNTESSDFIYLTESYAANSQTTLDAEVWVGFGDDGDWENTNNWEDGAVPTSSDNVVISVASSYPVITADAAINHLELESGTSLTVNSGASLAIFGNVINYGTYTVNRNTTGDEGYSIIGSPVSETILDGIGASHLYANDGAGYSSNLKTSIATMIPGQGYFAAFNSSSPSISFTGTPNTGDISYSVDNGEFELVANPYAAAISIEDFLTNNSSVISGAVYFWDDGGSNNGSKRGGDFIAANSLGATSIIQPDNTEDNVDGVKGSAPAESGVIPSVQGVFVEAIADGEITFSQDLQVITTDANSDNNFYRKQSEAIIVKLAIAGNNLYNEAIVGMTNDATLGIDHHLDARKLTSDYALSLYSLINQNEFIIQGVPMINLDERSVELGFSSTSEGMYEIKTATLSNLTDDLEVLLIDQLEGKTIKLSESETYQFKTDAGTFNQRFTLSFRYKDVLKASTFTLLNVKPTTDGLLITYPATDEQSIAIFTLDGKLRYSDQIIFENDQAEIPFKANSNEIYILRLDNQSIKFMIKN